MYIYTLQSELSHTKVAIRKMETLAECYIFLDLFLLKFITTPEKETAL